MVAIAMPSRRTALAGVLVIAVAALILGVRLSARADDGSATSAASAGSAGSGEVEAVAMPRSAEIEAEYGIRIERVSLIGAAGVVELRYVLVDADLAGVLHADEQDFSDDFPHLVADDTRLWVPTFHHHGGDLVTGREFSILYGNDGGVIRTGDLISIEVGEARLDGVPVT